MASMVIDASVTAAWFLVDEITPEHQRLLERVEMEEASVPAHWHLEVASCLINAARRGRIAEASVPMALVELSTLPVHVDALTGHYAWERTTQLALKHRLTPYDAAYLELASRMGLPLATLDVALARAARLEGVVTFAADVQAG